MPLDPFFTSTATIKQRLRRKVSKKRLLNPDEVFRKDKKKSRSVIPMQGAPALEGFKPPEKVWDVK
jgi:hypothetical protein